jgi:hypothetical protein
VVWALVVVAEELVVWALVAAAVILLQSYPPEPEPHYYSLRLRRKEYSLRKQN